VSRRSKAHRLAELIEEVSLDLCQAGCGAPYPDQAIVLHGYVIVAGLNAGKEYSAPTLSIWSPDEVNEWYDAYVKLRRARVDKIEAYNESMVMPANEYY
jgi:hypothetical protein